MKTGYAILFPLALAACDPIASIKRDVRNNYTTPAAMTAVDVTETCTKDCDQIVVVFDACDSNPDCDDDVPAKSAACDAPGRAQAAGKGKAFTWCGE